MKTHISPKLERLANKVSKIPFMKTILKPIYYKYKKQIEYNRFSSLHLRGVRVLHEFDNVMVANHINYTVYAGTLLGAIREKGLLKHDLDIDTAIWNKDFGPHIEQSLSEAGFSLIRRFEIDRGKLGREDTYSKDGVDIDIFYIYCDENGTYNTDYHNVDGAANFYDSMIKFGHVNARRCNLPVSYETNRVPFENIMVSAMCNAEDWLIARYGKNYMIPDPDFKDSGRAQHIYYWECDKATYSDFRK